MSVGQTPYAGTSKRSGFHHSARPILLLTPNDTPTFAYLEDFGLTTMVLNPDPILCSAQLIADIDRPEV